VRWRAWLACLTVVIVAVAPLLRTLHRAFVPHAVCEHGDLIELGHPRASTAADGNDEIGRRNGDPGARLSSSIVNASSPVLSQSHAHCASEALVRSNIAITARPWALVFSLEWDATDSMSSDPFCQRPILLNAPKTSPPV
jgi:hypothetical protein